MPKSLIASVQPLRRLARAVESAGCRFVPEASRRRLRLVNKMSAIGLVTSGVYALAFLVAGNDAMALPLVAVVSCYLAILVLHHRGATRRPRLLLPLVHNAAVFYLAATVQPDINLHVYFYSAPVVAFMTFETTDRVPLVTMSALPAVLALVHEQLSFVGWPMIELSPALAKGVSLASIPTAIALVAVPLFLIHDENHRNEQRLNAEVDTRRTLEQELRELHAELYQYLEHVPMGVLVLARGGEIVFANDQARKIAAVEVVVGGGAWDSAWPSTFVRGSDRPYSLDDLPLSRALLGEEHSADDLEIERDGRRIPVFLKAVPIRDEGGELLSVVACFEDASQRVRAENDRLHGQKLESVGQLAAGIAHEINTPMQYIGDNAHFLAVGVSRLLEMLDLQEAALERAGLDEAERTKLSNRARKLRLPRLRERMPRAVAASVEGVEAVTKIVSAMKEFSHPGSEEKRLENLNQALETTVTVSRNEWKYVADVQTELDAALPDVPCLLGELNQVFLNLVVNAAHAIRERVGDSGNRGTIVLRTRSLEGAVEVQVEDDGTGIPAGVVDRIFNPFFTTKEVGKGTGQGLAIARSIVVDKHLGSLDVESTVGRGTTFYIRLPLHEPATEAA